ncbi:SMI1/KNR4 family protein [Paludisphaera mucosa]|uniref:SMI1/KNR4 family protein n=1 Tax=Paludisphaera mucosa TaxID=3030827 RepID=A0ABT6FGD8_9BACT|nr:SMI1/KNR4 family protein [Paludisphaera mucosa]MDG3006646.1 SMI1/KNR4 family protein [Paludisphaera mucosa]
MRPDTIEHLDAMFAEWPIMRASDAPSEAEITQAERQIGVHFDDDFREFLLRYGGGMVGPYPIFGLRPVEVMGIGHWSVLDVTRHYRSEGVPDVERWVVISEDHAGHPVGMDAEGAIWIHDHDFGGISAIAESFEEYLRDICLKLSGPS